TPTPVAVGPAAMPGAEREAAETIEDRLSPIHLDRPGVVRSVTHDHVGAGIDRRVGDLDLVVETWPVRVDGKPPRLKPSPLLGQHGAEVLNDWLGLSSGAIAAVESEGVLKGC